jgi:hypothetical protein
MADQEDYADNAEHESSGAGRNARGTTSSRRAAPTDTATSTTLGGQPAEPTLDLFGDGPAPELVGVNQGTNQGVSPKVNRAMASPAARRAARQKTAPLVADTPADATEPYFHADKAQEDAPIDTVAVTDAPARQGEVESAEPPASAKTADAENAANEATEQPDAAAQPASSFSYAPTSASGNPAHLTSVVHAADFEAAVHGPVHAHADKTPPADIAAALAVQARRTKWMLTAAVAALAVTAVAAAVQTIVLANISSAAQAQQQRIELLLQNQQAALDKLTARLDAPPVVAMAATAPVVAAPVAPTPARAQSASAPSRRAERAAKAKAAEKAAEKAEKEKAASRAAAKAHAQSGTRQTMKN